MEAQIGGISRWWMHFSALSLKFWLVAKRRPIMYAFVLLLPAAFLGLLYGLNESLTDLAFTPPDNGELRVPPLTPCVAFDINGMPDYSAPCVTVVWGPTTDSTAAAVMRRFAEETGLAEGADVLGLNSVSDVTDYVYLHPGLVDSVIAFTQTGAHTQYALWYNTTNAGYYNSMRPDTFYQETRLASRILATQIALESAVVKVNAHITGAQPLFMPSLDQFTTYDPVSPSAEATPDFGLIRPLGPTFIVMGYTVVCLILLSNVVTEKVQRLLGAMRMMGVYESAYWWSWFLNFGACGLLASLILVVLGHILALEFFTQCDFSVSMFVFFMFFISMAAGTLFIASLMNSQRAANLFAFLSFFVVAIVMLLWGSGRDMATLYTGSTKFYAKLLTYWCPIIHFTKLWIDIIDITGYKLAPYKGRFFTWQDMTNPGTRLGPTVHVTGPLFDTDPPGNALGWLLVMTIIYMVLAWYFSQVIAGEAGASQPWLFPFQKSYWGIRERREPTEDGDTLAELQRKSADDRSIVLHKLSKSYDAKSALKEVSMTAAAGQLLALLGQNGAGKTTLVGCLSGFLDPTHGEAYMFGYSVRDDMVRLRDSIGNCPQHDVLWEQLTGLEHMLLFARLKGVPREEVQVRAAQLLEQVQLPVTGYGSQPTSNYSGGMKRRLSVVMAAVGMPDVLFLDEPTTGMDPLSRRRVWDLIQTLKQDRIIILTTHSMEEADALGDQIAILADGRLRAAGSPLFLKNHFGSGYQVNLLAQSGKITALDRLIKDFLPGAEIVSHEASNVTVCLPRDCTQHIPVFLRKVQEDKAVVREWGISNSTLEEVFLKLVASGRQVIELREHAPLPAPNVAAMCANCGARRSEVVELLAASGLRVQVAGVLCKQCALGDTAPAPDAAPAPAATPVDSDVPVQADAGATPPAPATPAEENKDQEEPSTNLQGVDMNAASTPRSYSSPLFASQSSQSRHAFELEMPGAAAADGSPAAPAAPASAVPVLTQAGAIVRLRLNVEKKQRKTNCCRCCCSVLAVIIIVLYGLIAMSASEANSSLFMTCPPGFKVYRTDSAMCDSTGFAAAMRQAATPLFQTFCDSKSHHCQSRTDWRAISNTYCNLYNESMPAAPNSTAWANRYSCDDVPARVLVQVPPAASAAWSRIPNTYDNVTQLVVKFTSSGAATVDSVQYAGQQVVQSHETPMPRDLGCYYVSSGYLFPTMSAALTFVDHHLFDAGLAFHNLQLDSGSVLVDYALFTMPGRGYRHSVVFASDSWNSCGAVRIGAKLPSVTDIAAVFNGVHNMALQAVTSSAQSIQATILELPQVIYQPSVVVTAGPLFIIFPLMFSFLFPAFAGTMVDDKENRLYLMMRVEGIRNTAYWLGNYMYFMLINVIFSIFFVILCYVMGIDAITQSNFGVFLALVLDWSHAQAAIAFLLAGTVNRARVVTILSYIFVILLTIACFLTAAASSITRWPFVANMFPPVAFIRSSALILRFGAGSIAGASEVSECLLCMFFFSILVGGIGIYLHAVLPRAEGYGVPAHPLLCLHRWLYRRRNRSRGAHALLFDVVRLALAVYAVVLHTSQPLGDEDPDVAAEKEAALAPSAIYKNAVCLQGVFKHYAYGGTVKLAVNDISMRIQPGECFGLLGPNGAGKTSLLNILCGNTLPSAGAAYMGGLAIANHMERINKILGVCPQFDTVFPELTVREHLSFYGRAKGISPQRLAADVQQTAEHVGLDGDALTTVSSKLSGGMRRRLSLGIALIGSPRILLLDEPTTGLDPDTRRQIWSIVQGQRRAGTTIILTTHSMEEADTLCSRLGIMALGSMRCIGSQQRLKERFGHGYKLSVTLNSERSLAAVDQFVQSLSAGAERVSHIALNAAYMLPRATVDVAHLFQSLESEKQRVGIMEWGIAQTSLEEVFIRIARESEQVDGVL